ncbi:MAG: aminopeptidase P family protein, partial [Anaerolineaceae bacterium]|nr:aminopeptidase P family protein [Anaerolineaceae bacterium]
MANLPQVLSIRKQAEVITKILHSRLDTILPLALREAGIDMWLIICQEDNHDPIFNTMIPMDTWAPILQMLIFFDRGAEGGVERINLSMTDTKDLYDRPWKGQQHPEQWGLLSEIIRERSPKRIGINIGDVNWAAGGLTYNLYHQLCAALPDEYVRRLTSAEVACNRWGMTLTKAELALYPHIASIAHRIIADCYSPTNITPGVTTTKDLEWVFWQRCADNSLGQAFKPFFRIIRSDLELEKHPLDDLVIRRGDLLHCDVGIKYLGLNTDHQELAYVCHNDEMDAPRGLKNLLAKNNRLQKIFLDEFKHGLSGNQMLKNMLATAREGGIPSPRIYSHSLGLFLHEPGPLIGLP